MIDLKSFFDLELRTDTANKAAQVEKDMRGIDESLKKTRAETKKTSDEFTESGIRVAKTTGEADRRFKANRQAALSATDGVNTLSGGYKNLLASMAGYAKAGLLAAGIGAITLSVAGAIQTFGTFEQKLADLSAITGATGKDLEYYSEQAREMAKTSTLGASEIVNAFQLVGSAKPELLKNAEALKTVTASAMTLAEAAGIDVPQAADVMASALNQFGAGADQADRFINVLAAGANFGAAEIADMGEAMKMSGTVAAQFGLSFEDANAALQLLSTNAIKGSMAGTNLKGVILALETRMSDNFKPSVVGIAQAMENLSKENLSASEMVKLFGRENITAGQIMMNNSGQLKQLISDVTGTNMAYDQAATRTDTLQGAQKRLGNAFEELALVLTDDSGIGALLKWLVEGFTGLINIFSFAVGGIVELTKAWWDLMGAGLELIGLADPLSKFIGSAVDSFQYLAENIDYVRLIMANDLINAVFHVGEFLEVTFKDMVAPVYMLYNAFVDLVAYIMDMSTKVAPVLDAIFGEGTAAAIANNADRVRLLKKEIKDHATIVEETRAKYDGYRQAMNETTEAEVAALRVKKEQEKASEKMKADLEAEAEAQEALTKEQEKAKKAIDGVMASLKDELYAVQHTSKETAIYNKLKQAGVAANSEAGREIIALIDKIEEEKDAVEKVKDAWKRKTDSVNAHLKELHDANDELMKDIVKSSENAAQEQVNTWKSARDTLSGFFFEFAKEGIGAFDTLVEGFRAMLYKMMAEAAANQIIIGVSPVLGGTSAANAASAVSGSTGGAVQGLNLLSTGKSLLSGGIQGGFNAMAGGYESIANWAQASNLPGMQNVAGAARTSAGQYTGSLGSSVMNAGLNVGAGLIGGYAGSKVFGDTTGIGSTVGGMVGSIWGPIGTGIGSFIGAGLEKGLTKLFGYGGNNNDGKNTARASFDFETDTFGKGEGSGNSWKKGEGKEQAEGVDQLMAYIKDFGDKLGGVTLKGGVSLDSRGQASFNGKEFSTATGMLEYAFKEIVKNSSEVDDALEAVILGFKGTAEEFVAFAQTQVAIDKAIKAAENLTPELEAMARQFVGSNEDALLFTASLISLTDALSTNAVTDATTAFAEAQQIAADGILGAYNRQSDVLIDAIQNFDGSAASMADLNNAMILSKQSAFELSIGVMNLKQSMNDMFMSSAQSIREQLMSETELAKSRLEERDALRAAIDTMLDPQEIQKAAEKMNDLNNKLFGALNEDEKKLYGEEFAKFGEDAAEAVSGRLDSLLEKTTASQQALMDSTGALLKEYADKGLEAAKIQRDAAETILRASANIPKTIVVTVRSDGSTITELQQ